MAELNSLARRWMAESGRLSGPELATPDGASYRAGDHAVALAPSRDGALTTSQRTTVEAVDLSLGILALRTVDGRRISLRAEDAGADRLGHAYATTVHRSQGATTTRAHLFADGGGRELAYVAMSRAREGTEVWKVADDLVQAREDLAREWSSRAPHLGDRHRATRRGQAGPDRLSHPARRGEGARHRCRWGTGNLSADAMRAALPADPSPRLDAPVVVTVLNIWCGPTIRCGRTFTVWPSPPASGRCGSPSAASEGTRSSSRRRTRRATSFCYKS